MNGEGLISRPYWASIELQMLTDIMASRSCSHSERLNTDLVQVSDLRDSDAGQDSQADQIQIGLKEDAQQDQNFSKSSSCFQGRCCLLLLT